MFQFSLRAFIGSFLYVLFGRGAQLQVIYAKTIYQQHISED